MRLPRDLNGAELVKRLAKLGCRVTWQTGGHIRLTSKEADEHHLTVPRHDLLRVGTLAAILDAVAARHRISRADLPRTLGK